MSMMKWVLPPPLQMTVSWRVAFRVSVTPLAIVRPAADQLIVEAPSTVLPPGSMAR